MTSSFTQTNLSLKQTVTALEANFRQFMDKGPGQYLPLSLWGHSGIGKTTIINDLAKSLAEKLSKELGRKVTIGVRSFQMSAMQPFDLSGYPMVDKDTYKGFNAQCFATPQFLLEASKYDYYILFFDEWNRARQEMHNAFMGYIDGRGVNGHEIPNNVFCVSAANPPTDNADYGAITDVEDQAILDRLIHVNVVPTQEEFKTYLYHNKECHEAIQAFLEEDHERLPDNNFKGITNKLRKTNRGLTNLAKAVIYLTNVDLDVNAKRALIEAIAKGIVGDSTGSVFADRFQKCEFLTSPEALLAGDVDAFNKIKAATNRDNNNETQLDRVKRVADNLIRLLNQEHRNQLKKKEVANLLKFLEMIPHDIAENVLTKVVTFTDKEKSWGIKEVTTTTLKVTSDEGEGDLTWR